MVVDYALNPIVVAKIPHALRLLNALRSQLLVSLGYRPPEKIYKDLGDTTPERDAMAELLSRFEDRQKHIRQPLSIYETKLRVDAQLASIKDLIGKHDLDLAIKWLRDLVIFQVKHGEKKHLAMSLCALAATALEVGETEFAEMLTDHAEALGIEDPVIFGSKAGILRAVGNLKGALVEFDSAITRFPFDSSLQNGRAEVLKALGRFDEALATYDHALKQFPNNEVAQAGRAELLKAMGRFQEALAAYDEVVNQFPGNAVARSGRAELLKAMGRFDEAMTAYDEAVEQVPGDVVPQSGRAEVLKATGRFDEALTAYDEALRRFPRNVVVQTGRAEVLRSMGRFDEALIVYNEALKRFPRNAVVHAGRAEVLKARGRFDEALAAYDEAAKQFPGASPVRNGRAEVLKAMGRFDEAFTAYNDAVKQFPSDVVTRNGRAEVLKAMGKFDRALAAYDEAVEQFPTDVVTRNGRAEVLKAMGRLEDALVAYRETRQRFPYNTYALGGYVSVLLLTDRIAEARQLLLPEIRPASAASWSLYHMLGMMYLKTGNLDAAIAKLTYGTENAPWCDVPFFVSSLALARIRKKQFEAALSVLERDIGLLDIIQRRRRVALIGHSQAAIGEKQKAVMSLKNLGELGDPNLLSLRSFLIQRYSLDEQVESRIDYAALDAQIAQKEFLIAVA